MKLNNLLIAHRGVHDNIKIPENSLKAFKQALNNDLNIELDVQLTKDNIIIVFHDKNLKRMTNLNKNVEDCFYHELKNLTLLNTNEKIPLLKEVLELINGKVLLDIEIKETKKIKTINTLLIKELKDYKKPYIIKSFNPKIIKWFNKNKINCYKGILINNKKKNNLYYKFLLKYCKPDFIAIEKKFFSNKKKNIFLEKYPILLWTINNKNEINKYSHITNNYICNNIPFK